MSVLTTHEQVVGTASAFAHPADYFSGISALEFWIDSTTSCAAFSPNLSATRE
jgi:hypothetical protein